MDLADSFESDDDETGGILLVPGWQTLHQPTTFRFLDLPYDIRRIVYDLLPRHVVRPMLSARFGVFYKDALPCVSLLLTCRKLSEEAASAMTTIRSLQPSTILLHMCRLDGDGLLRVSSFRDPLPQIIMTLDMAVGFDYHYTNRNGQDLPASQQVSRWTTEIPSKHFVRGLQREASFAKLGAREFEIAQITGQDVNRLKTFLAASVLRLRRNPSLQVRMSLPDLTDDIYKTMYRFLSLQPVNRLVPYSEPKPWASELKRNGSRFVCRITLVSATVEQNALMFEALRPLDCAGVTCEVATAQQREMIGDESFNVVY